MRRVAIILTLVTLVGCSTMSSLTKFIPKKYDPAMGSLLVDLTLEVNDLDCITSTEKTWDIALYDAKRLTAYAEFRNDPQSENVAAAEKNLNSAKGKGKILCENYLKIAKTRLKIVDKAWSTR